MQAKIAHRRKIAQFLGSDGTRALEHCLNSVERILPHTELSFISYGTFARPGVVWNSTQRTQLRVTFVVGHTTGYSVVCTVQRRALPMGVGSVNRALDYREKLVCQSIVNVASMFFGLDSAPSESSVVAARALFDELVVANYLSDQHHLKLDPFELIVSLRHLAEQTYENSAFTFGCIVDTQDQSIPGTDVRFPERFFSMKRYRALSDAYYTAYRISSAGKLLDFVDLYAAIGKGARHNYFPEWCAQFAEQSRTARLGIALNRQG